MSIKPYVSSTSVRRSVNTLKKGQYVTDTFVTDQGDVILTVVVPVELTRPKVRIRKKKI